MQEMLGKTSSELLKATPIVGCLDEIEAIVTALVKNALKNRQTKATHLNSHSSRKHVTVEIQIDGLLNALPFASNYLIVDMAGTKPGMAEKDSCAINVSVGDVIDSIKKLANTKPLLTSSDVLVKKFAPNLESTQVILICTISDQRRLPSGV